MSTTPGMPTETEYKDINKLWDIKNAKNISNN
jgi:hypothetical protein